MNPEPEQDVLAASFDIVARQDRTDDAISRLQTELDEAKARLARLGRSGASRWPQVTARSRSRASSTAICGRAARPS